MWLLVGCSAEWLLTADPPAFYLQFFIATRTALDVSYLCEYSILKLLYVINRASYNTMALV
jgi:hypothetical protein